MLYLSYPLVMAPPVDGAWEPAFFLIATLVYLGIAAILILPPYILNALSLYRIAKRREINHPWLAWVPVGSAWILGCISDQYQLLVHQKKTHRAPILLVLIAGSVIGYFLILVLTFRWLKYATLGPEPLTAMWPTMLALDAMIAVSIAAAVFTFLAKYDLFRSCEPKNAVAYLIISIAVQCFIQVAGIVSPILMLVVSKKDEGMPQPQNTIPFPDHQYDEPQ